jgi:hypothetical protein
MSIILARAMNLLKTRMSLGDVPFSINVEILSTQSWAVCSKYFASYFLS